MAPKAEKKPLEKKPTKKKSIVAEKSSPSEKKPKVGRKLPKKVSRKIKKVQLSLQ
ncbi:unnamed protein product [Lupinus luteus]|uniref:Uncharacterized protein n=1 Tax=Lupinus luteus TaxID=3873 RepID=A0AAV1YFZ9_LUPLU